MNQTKQCLDSITFICNCVSTEKMTETTTTTTTYQDMGKLSDMLVDVALVLSCSDEQKYR
jgi:hypothetical protein